MAKGARKRKDKEAAAGPKVGPAAKTDRASGNPGDLTRKPGKEKSEAACGAEPSSTPIDGKHNK